MQERLARLQDAPPEAPPAASSSAAGAIATPSSASSAPRARKTFRQGRPATRAQKLKKAHEYNLAHDAARQDEIIGELRAFGAGVTDDTRPRAVPRELWIMVRKCMADLSGRAIRYFLEREPNRALSGYLLEAALAGGRRSWADLRARRIVTEGLLVGGLAKYSRRKGPWGGVVMGIPQSAILEAQRNPYDTRPHKLLPVNKTRSKPVYRDVALPHRNTLKGKHGRDGIASRGQAGYTDELEECGALYTQRLPPNEAEPFETLGESGYATLRYWLPSMAVERIADDAARYELLRAAQVAHDARTRWANARSSRAADLGSNYEPPF